MYLRDFAFGKICKSELRTSPKTNCVTDPTLLFVQSDGPAGESHPGKMGAYRLQEEKFNENDLWKQDNGKNYLFYSKGKFATF